METPTHFAAPRVINCEGLVIRGAEVNGEPWFVAKDICMALFDQQSVHRQGTTPFLQHLTVEEKLTLKRDALLTLGLTHPDSKARMQTLISESGLYKLIMRSDRPEAKPFQDWVTREVLPAIRKHGGYIFGEERMSTGEISEGDLLARAIAIAEDKLARARSSKPEEGS